MDDKDLENFLQQLETPEVNNPAHQFALRQKLLEEHAQMQSQKKPAGVFDLITNAFSMKRFSFALATLLLALLVGFVYYTNLHKPGAEKPVAKQPIQNQNPQTNPQPEKQLIAQNTDWKEVQWHDPANPVIGYKFDIPNTWIEVATSSEREISVASCQPEAGDCDYATLSIIAASANYSNYVDNLISGNVAKQYDYSQSTTTVAGIPATLLSNSDPVLGKVIYLQKDNEWFVFHLYPGQKNEKNNYALLDKIIATFAFTAKEGYEAPAEYEMFKSIAEWVLTYQLKRDYSTSSFLVCADGRKGNTSSEYVFSMNTKGDTNNGTTPGDINTPFAKVIDALKSNGWTDCGIPLNQQDPTNGNFYVFIKDNRLIGINKHYSMGTGNDLNVIIQYDK